MLDPTNAPMSDPETVRSGIAAVATIVVAAITTIGARIYIGRKPKPEPEPDGNEPVVAPSPLANFSGTQNEFMALVIEDNQAIRTELQQVRTDLATTKGEVVALRAELAATLEQRTKFERAVRRYLSRIAVYVETLGGVLPQPDDDDLAILEHTLPRHRRPTT